MKRMALLLVLAVGPQLSAFSQTKTTVPGHVLVSDETHPGAFNPQVGNSKTLIDVSTYSSGDLGSRMKACESALKASGGVCDGRGLGNLDGSGNPIAYPWTTTFTQDPAKPNIEYILPIGHIARGVGVQWIATAGWIRVHGSLTQVQTVIDSDPSDTSPAFYTPTLVGFLELDHFRLTNHKPGYWGMDLRITDSYIHDIEQNGRPRGWGMILDNSPDPSVPSCNCYNKFSNLKMVNIKTGGNTNWNNWDHIKVGDPTLTTWAFDFSDGYLNLINGLSIENTPQSVRFSGSAHDNEIKNFNLENDGILGTGSKAWLPGLEFGSMRNKVDSKVDVVDNSGNLTNVYGTLSSLPTQTSFPGKFAVTRVADPAAPGVNATNCYYCTDPLVILPSAAYFTGGSYSIEAWVYPTLPSYSSLPRFEYLVDIGNGPPLTDRVALGIDWGLGKPFVIVQRGLSYSPLTYAATAVTPRTLTHVVVVWDSGTGQVKFYVNNKGDATPQILPAPLNVTRSTNAIGSTPSGNHGSFHGDITEVAIYPTALSSATVQNHYTKGISGADNYPSAVAADSPTAYWRLNDLPTAIRLTAATPSGGSTIYTGTIAGCTSGSAFNQTIFRVAGFSNSTNNSAAGPFVATACTSTMLTLKNPHGVRESGATATAQYPNVAAATVGRNGTYSGVVTLNSASGIPSYSSGRGKSAQFGGDTLWSYYQIMNDWNGGQTLISPAGAAVNFSVLDASNYNVVTVAGVPGVHTYHLLRGGTSASNYIAQGFLASQFPINDNGGWPASTGPAIPTRNSTGDSSIPGRLGIGTASAGMALDVVGGSIRSDTGFCIAASCITSWPKGVTASGSPSAPEIPVFAGPVGVKGNTPSPAGYSFTSKGAGTDPSFEAPPLNTVVCDPMDMTTVCLLEEFPSGVGTTGAVGSMNWTFTPMVGGSAGVNPVAGTWPHLGVVSANSPAASGQGVRLTLARNNSSGLGNIGGNGGWDSYFEFAFGVSSGASYRVGYGPNDPAVVPTSGFYLRFDPTLGTPDATIHLCSDLLSIETCSDTGVAPDTNYHKLRIRSTVAGTVGLTFDSGREVTICAADCTITATPTTNNTVSPFFEVVSATASTSENILADFWRFKASGLKF